MPRRSSLRYRSKPNADEMSFGEQMAHMAGALVGGDEPVEVFGECFWAEAFGGPAS